MFLYSFVVKEGNDIIIFMWVKNVCKKPIKKAAETNNKIFLHVEKTERASPTLLFILSLHMESHFFIFDTTLYFIFIFIILFKLFSLSSFLASPLNPPATPQPHPRLHHHAETRSQIRAVGVLVLLVVVATKGVAFPILLNGLNS
jgi:hypothetical protein